MRYICRKATLEDVLNKQNQKINNHPGDDRWIVWKEEAIQSFNDNTVIQYYGFLDGKIITEATAVISKDDKFMQNKEGLIDDETAYLQAFGTNKEYEGKGYFSKLYKYMENDLKKRGFKTLTLGVEPCEVRNILIYFNWGYTNYVKSAYEKYPNGEKVLVNFYSKDIN